MFFFVSGVCCLLGMDAMLLATTEEPNPVGWRVPELIFTKCTYSAQGGYAWSSAQACGAQFHT
eukprot:463063-Karenia_brevis.AAC.1